MERIIERAEALRILASVKPGDTPLCLATVEHEGCRLRLVRSDAFGQAPTLLSVESLKDIEPEFWHAVVRDGDFTLNDSATDG